MLHLALIGGVALSFNGQDVPLANRKARAMLAFLALNDQPNERRERLSGLLWSESDQGRASATLRQAVLEAHRALQSAGCDVLIRERLTVGLRAGGFTVDIEQMLAALADGATDDVPRHARVADLFMGGFEGLDPGLDEWLVARRQSLHAALIRALEQAWRNTAAPRRVRRAMAELALLQDPVHEEACRVVMRCAAEDADIGTALRAYEALYVRLGEEFGMEPSLATQALVAKIKQGEFEAPGGFPVYPHPVEEGPPWIAVLPFRTLGADPAAPYLAEGLVDDIVRMLAGLREPVVISSASTRLYRADGTDPGQAGRDLGVRYLVTGTARTAGPAMRLSVQLVDAATNAVQWAQAYDAEDGRLFEAQDRIVEEIVNMLAPRVHEAELRRIRMQRPSNLGAYHLTLEARELIFGLELDSFEKAGRLLSQAVAMEPNYAAAHAARAQWFSLRLGQRWSPDPPADVAELARAAHAAVRLDARNARALALLGHGKTIFEHNLIEGQSYSDRAVDAAPNDAEVWLWSSPTRAYLGQAEDAVRRAERALRLSPKDPFVFRTYHFLSLAHYLRGAYDEAAHWGTLSARANARYTSNTRLTAVCLAELGRDREAQDMVRLIMAVDPDFRAHTMLHRLPFRDAALRERFVRMLHHAGVPA